MAESTENLAGAPLDPSGIGPALAALDVEGKLDVEEESADLFASSPLFGDADARPALAPVRGRGRPPGSLNKTTDEWRAFWLRHYRSPLLLLGDLISADPFKLAAAIRTADKLAGIEREVSVLDVINLQRGAATDVAPYIHRKQPIAIDAGEDKSVPLFQQVILGAEALPSLFPQRAESADELAYVPAPAEDEVADEKSQAPGNGGASA